MQFLKLIHFWRLSVSKKMNNYKHEFLGPLSEGQKEKAL
jgi:hypothetical protein